MAGFWASLRKRFLEIPAGETSFERRGFRGGTPAMRARLEQVGRSFMGGYHAALGSDSLRTLLPELKAFDADFQGFAFEGAAMALALLDYLTPWRRHRVQAFLNGAGDAHAYMVHVGLGWVLARVPGNTERQLARLDPLLRWLAVDGYGFHEGFFHWRRYLIDHQPAPRRLRGYACRAFDQGLGRCLWFIDGGDVARIPHTIASLSPERSSDLWSGVGLASVYAGGVGVDELRQLRRASGDFLPHLAQGAAFAAKARLRAGNATDYTEAASGILCGTTAEAAARVTDKALADLPPDGAEPAYEIWRRRVQARLAASAREL